jgi:hypothetical protein
MPATALADLTRTGVPNIVTPCARTRFVGRLPFQFRNSKIPSLIVLQDG